MPNRKISTLPDTATVADLVGTQPTVIDDVVDGRTKQVPLALLRRALLAGGTGYVATDPLTAGAASLASLAVAAPIAGDLAGNADTATEALAAVTAATATTALGVADGAVSTAKIVDGAVTTGKLADNAVTTAKIADGAVGTTELADNAVATAKVADGAIATAKLADDAVTYAKLQNVSAASRLLGRGSAAGAGNAEELTLGTGLSMNNAQLNAATDLVAAGAPFAAVAVNNSTTHQTLQTRNIAVAVGDQIEFEMVGSFANNSGAAVTPNIRFTLGTLTADVNLGATLISNATGRSSFVLRGFWTVTATNFAVFVGQVVNGSLELPGNTQTSATGYIRYVYQTTTSDLTGASVACAIGMRSSTATATQTFTVHSFKIRRTAAI